MLMAGATVVGVGSAVWYRGVDAFQQINAELAAFMAQQGVVSVATLRGRALRPVRSFASFEARG
jgi:dihydroorotate dehydrogenase (NAD+) catalytic subunit